MKNNFNFDIDKKLSSLLKDHVISKYTKYDKKSYNDLLNYTIGLEISNNELQRKIESDKNEIFKLNQNIIDLKTDMNERVIKSNLMNNKLKIRENTMKTIKSIHSLNLDTDVGDGGIYNSQNNIFFSKNCNTDKGTGIYNRNIKNNDSYSINEEVSIDEANSLLGTLKKRRKLNNNIETEIEFFKEENKTLLNDVNSLVNEVRSLREHMAEKDKIITILYKEIDTMRNNSINNDINSNIVNVENPITARSKNNSHNSDNYNSPTLNKFKRNSENFTFNNDNNSRVQQNVSSNYNFAQKIHLENLEFIKNTLVEFLKNYGIQEDFQKIISNNNDNSKLEEGINNSNNPNNNLETVIEMRMKEIKYILINLKKINIIFKSYMVEFSKHIDNNIQTIFMETLNPKIAEINKKYSKIDNILNKFINK
jgi:hypothetical protein